MAIDEVLLGRAAKGITQLRVYRWSEPTLSLGYFQSIAERQSHLPSLDCALVRRSTGGGAIVHDREITYSLALPWSGGAEGVARQRQLYQRIHSTLVELLGEGGIRAEICASTVKQVGPFPFLCFERLAAGDVMVQSFKVAGSAQRRIKGALLQHGSVLLEASPAAPELKGIHDLSHVRMAPDEWGKMLARTVISRLGCEPVNHPLDEDEERAAATLAAERFGTPAWNERR